ncbi:MAG TPA: MTAP family purine nucleoside phosphorylase [Opitutaceae bacterium]|nr:MTAP family purine nucleoside phosphorylase [Opitutaceae bacterium]
MKVAFLSGTSIARSALFDEWTVQTVETRYGNALVRRHGEFVLLNRHGPDYLPPHAINYRANIQALADLGFRDVVSLNSVGSLQLDLPPGTLVSCADYISFRPATFSDTELRALGPEIANNLVARIAAALPEPLPQGKIYIQTPGPRFETRAEVRVLRQWGDVVGMTAANEADLCRELGLNYNSLCMVDNYANGILGTELSPESFQALVRANQEKVNTLFRRLLELFA